MRWEGIGSGGLHLPESAVSVIDSYLAPRQTYLDIVAGSGVCVCIDDFERIEYPDGIVVRTTAVLSANPGHSSGAVRNLIGPEYHLIRREFWDLTPKRAISKEVNRIFITLGGTTRQDLLERLVDSTSRRFPNAQIDVVAGFDAIGVASQLKGAKKRTIVHGILSSAAMRDLMLASDLAVSAGGQTSLELARCGVPVIAIVIAENQRENIKGLVARGAAFYGGSDADPGMWDILGRALEEAAIPDKRQALSEAGKSLIDGQGPRRVVTAAMERLGMSSRVDVSTRSKEEAET
jgi:spore coat polysaccharide biosynthesis predicted glycosyltransferase SpsG